MAAFQLVSEKQMQPDSPTDDCDLEGGFVSTESVFTSVPSISAVSDSLIPSCEIHASNYL